MRGLRKKIKDSEGGIFFIPKRLYYFKKRIYVPAPKVIFVPIQKILKFVMLTFDSLRSIFFVTPIYKSYFENVGSSFYCGKHLPFILGSGKIYVGNNVKIYGKVNFIFGSIGDKTPEIHIGDDVHLSHNITLDVSGSLKVGAKTRIAENVTIQDCGGHPLDPEKRSKDLPPTDKDIKPIVIGENSWIGASSHILPGVKIGENSVVGAGVVLRRKIPDNSIVYMPAPEVRKYRNLNQLMKPN